MKIQCAMRSYSGDSATVYSLWHEGILVVQKALPRFEGNRFKDSLIISDSDLPARESLFTDDAMQDALDAYMFMRNSGELDIRDSAAIANPENSVQPAETTNGTKRWHVKPEIPNAHIAVIATCWHIRRSLNVDRTIDFSNSIMDLQRGGVTTI